MKYLAILFVVALSVAATAQTFTVIDVPGGTWTLPAAIGKNGGVIGQWSGGSFFRTGKGTYHKMSGRLEPVAINSTGTIVGTSIKRAYQPGFIRNPQGVVTLLYFANHRTLVAGLNDAGIMVGTYEFVGQPNVAWTGTATSYTAITMPDGTNIRPVAINNAGNVAGSYIDQAGTVHGVIWSTTGTTDFTVPGATGTWITTLDDLGYFAGGWEEGTTDHCYVNDVNGFTSFDPTGAMLCSVTGRNKTGVITGYYLDVQGAVHAFRREPKGVITTIDPPGSITRNVQGINGAGTIVGNYWDGTNEHAFIYKP